MKLFLILLGIVAAGVLGYRMEPSLRFQVTGILPKDDAAKMPVPEDSKLPAIDPASFTAEQLPEKVTLSAEVKVTDAAADVTMTIPAGSRVKLVRIEGTNAVVSPGEGPYSGTLPISQTDLMVQLAASLPPAVTPPPSSPEPLAGDPAPTPEPAPDTAPSTEPSPAPVGDSAEPTPMPEPVVDPQPEPTPDPVPADPAPEVTPEPAPVVEPAPTPTPTPTPAPTASGSAAVVKVMQTSIRNGQIKEFTYPQVLSWKQEANETVDGQVFQTGSVTYKAETIFGVKTIQAKAHIKGGKVHRWIWPKSGMEIK